MLRLRRVTHRLARPNVVLPLVSAAVLTVSALASGSRVFANPKGPTPVDRQVTVAVTRLLETDHLSRHRLNDEIASRWLKTYLKTLDPLKVYFYQSDIDEFERKARELTVVTLKNKDLSFGYKVFERFLQRVDERVKMIDELLDQPHDFTVDEEMITDPDKLSFPQSPEQAKEAWRKRIKYDLLVLKADNTEGQAAIDKLHRRYHAFARRMHQSDNDELLEMYLTSMTTSYDPHTTYMSPGSYENFQIQMKLKLSGIGAALQFVDGYTQVSSVIAGGPADKDGRIKPKDRVIGVGQGASGEIEDVVDMKLNDVVKKIRGKEGTVVRLQVIPDGQNESVTYSITRAEIQLKDSEARSEVIETGKKPDGTPFKVGVIDLPSFYMDMEGAKRGDPEFKSTTRDVALLLDDFNRKAVDVVVVDLRKNGGGSLTEAINLTGLFIDHGPVVQVKDPGGQVQHYDDNDRGMAWSGPLVVLTSKFSASASEIFAGAIQDYQRGLIVGDASTHGKGTVQSLLDLGQQVFHVPQAPSLGALKITIQQFYRPNGDSTQNRGVLADVPLPSISSNLDVGESSLDYAVAFDNVQPVNYRRVGLVGTGLIERINLHSKTRRAESEDFAKLEKKISHYLEQKERKRQSLNETKFLADRADLNTEKEEANELEELQDQHRPVVKLDFYFKEVLNIAVDYAQQLAQQSSPVAVGQR